MTPEQFEKLRAPFKPEQIGKLPKPTKKENPKGKCPECGGYHGLPAVHLDYVGHAAITDRLLQVDPTWSWEPMATNEQGFPLVDQSGGLWIKLTVCGVTRPGYGDETAGKGMKEVIGDALRNAAMRFGVGLDLWSKENLNGDEDSATGGSSSSPQTVRPAAGAASSHPQAGSAAPAFKAPEDVLGLQESRADRVQPDDGGEPGAVLLTFGKHKGKRVRDAPEAYLEWWLKQEPPGSPELRRQRAAVEMFLGRTPAGQLEDPDVPFAWLDAYALEPGVYRDPWRR